MAAKERLLKIRKDFFFKCRISMLYVRHYFKILWVRLQALLQFIYKKYKLYEIVFFIYFIFGRYNAKQFNPSFVKNNLKILVRITSKEGLTATKEGCLKILSSKRERFIFKVLNFITFSALQKRVEKIVYFSIVTITIELYNPFTKKVLKHFLQKKLTLLEGILDHVKYINGRRWNQRIIKLHIDLFQRNSLLQADIITSMERAARKQKPIAILGEATKALLKGLNPILITTGLSGSYWMRGSNRDILGLFKPYDEEIHAPNNPLGPLYQGSLGLRKTRRGCRTGEAAHHEVAAYVVDEFFGFGIVPKTYYATFKHSTFFYAREDRLASLPFPKTKWGSFQEFVGGFVSIGKLTREEINSIPLDEFQLLVTLDVIIGNTDRHLGNILYGDEKIAAIDHGLSFTDKVSELSYQYWAFFDQGKEPFFKPIVDLLNHFPFDALAVKLKKRCFISTKTLHRMRERVTLFTEAVNAELVPAQLIELFTSLYLAPLEEKNTTLKEAAQEQLQLFKERLLIPSAGPKY